MSRSSQTKITSIFFDHLHSHQPAKLAEPAPNTNEIITGIDSPLVDYYAQLLTFLTLHTASMLPMLVQSLQELTHQTGFKSGGRFVSLTLRTNSYQALCCARIIAAEHCAGSIPSLLHSSSSSCVASTAGPSYCA